MVMMETEHHTPIFGVFITSINHSTWD
jgi:hypothetical protein